MELMGRNVIIMTVLAAALGLAACNGGKDAASGSNYISEAEQQVALEQHPLFGEVPSLQKRQAKALDLLDDALDAERDAVRVKADNDNYEEVTAKVKELDAEQEAAAKEIEQYFTTKIDEAMKGLTGKEIPVEPDAKTYSAAKATIVGYKHAGGGNGNIVVNASFTAARQLKTLGSKYTQVSWNWIGASGERTGSGIRQFDTPFKSSEEVKLDSITVPDIDISKISFTDD